MCSYLNVYFCLIHYLVMEVEFIHREDGQVDAQIIGDWPLFNHALGDSISSLPHRGEEGNGPSTYWIDRAITGAQNSAAQINLKPFITGNSTQLSYKNNEIIASYDHDELDFSSDVTAITESIPFNDFIHILEQWKLLVIESANKHTEPLPETYRRNPLT